MNGQLTAVQQFAQEELARYYKGDANVTLKLNTYLTADCFEIEQDGADYIIAGGNDRALLYGVYRFLEKVEGLVFFDLYKPQHIAPEGIDDVVIGKPKFTRRGNVFETIHDVPFLKAMLDVGAKNGLNELFFTFFLWDEVKAELLPEIEKRGIDITLGGHSLRYLIAKARGAEVAGKDAIDGAVNDLIGEETEFTSAHALKNHDFLQDEAQQQAVIDLIVDYCKQEPVIRRISLWPEDVGAKGAEAEQFLTRYMYFTERLQQALAAAGLDVAAEHIVYNAGLSWEMLERNGQQPSEADILYAYWGRDYTEGYDNERDARAWQSLVDWRAASNKGLTIFEYYSDHFMLSELFPLLFGRMKSDIQHYKKAGCDGMLNLVVPLHVVAKAQPHMADYDYQQYQQLNNIVFARELWEGQHTLMYLLDEQMQQLALQLELIVGQNSRYNAQFFPSRVVEAKNPEAKAEVVAMLADMEALLVATEPTAPLTSYVQALLQVVQVTKARWEAL